MNAIVLGEPVEMCTGQERGCKGIRRRVLLISRSDLQGSDYVDESSK